MAQRPDSPTSGQPETPEVEVPDEQIVHHVSNRKKRKKGVGGEDMQLQMTSMIDVVFLLLIYFVITANFTIDEGTLLATMPGNSAPPDQITTPPDPPINIELTSADDGVTYAIIVNGQRVDNATALAGYMKNRVQSAQMAIDDIVQIKPLGVVRWQHVVNVFNACVSAKLENVGFAP